MRTAFFYFAGVAALAAQIDDSAVLAIGSQFDAYYTAVTRVYESAADGKEVNATKAWAAGNAFWKPTNQEAKIQAVNAAGFLLINKPASYEITASRIAGDYAKIQVRYETRGPVIRPGTPTKPKEVEYSLLRSGSEWKLVSFRNPEAENRKPPPEVAATTDNAGGGTAREHLENYLRFLRDLAAKPGPGLANPKALGDTLGTYWVAERDNLQTRSMVQSMSVFQLMKPGSWTIAPVSAAAGQEVFDVQYSAGTGGVSFGKGKTIRYTLVQESGAWKLQNRVDPDVPAPR